MTQRNNSAHHRLHLWQQGLTKKRFASTLPAQSLCWLSSVSLLSGGFVFAQTETQVDNIVPTVETSQPTVVPNLVKKQAVAPEAVQAQPEFSQRRARLKQRLRKPEVAQSKEPVRQSTPKIEAAEPVVIIRQKPKVETSQVTPARVRQENPIPLSAMHLKNSQKLLNHRITPTVLLVQRQVKPRIIITPILILIVMTVVPQVLIKHQIL